jgi:hypothetical protein
LLIYAFYSRSRAMPPRFKLEENPTAAE